MPKEIKFRYEDETHFNNICSSISTTGLDNARSHFSLEDVDTKFLSGKWEGYHLVKFGTYSKKKVADDENLEAIYDKYDWSIKQVQSLGSHEGRENSDLIKDIFKAISEAREFSLFECFVDFLDFCSKQNNGKGFPFSVFDYSQEVLLEELADKQAYLEEQLGDNPSSKSLNGLHIFWEKPNNEHEQPICKIEPCIGKKHLVVPNTQGNINLQQPSTVLGWRTGLTEFVPRKAELKILEAFLNSDAEKAIQFISGDGGVGKTRLAFEFADYALGLGWEAGQATTDLQGRWFMGEQGMLLIIDYPEERETTLKQFVRAVSEMDDIPKGKRLRIILLSRNKKFYDIVDEEAPGILAEAICLSRLNTKELRWQLVNNAWSGLLIEHKKTLAPQDKSTLSNKAPIFSQDFEKWIEQQSTHSTPLFIISLIYYLYCEPEATKNFNIELTGQSIIRYMTKREIKFIRKEVSYLFGLKKLTSTIRFDDICLLKALAPIPGKLNEDFLNVFLIALRDNGVVFSPPDVDYIKALSIWTGNAIRPVEPDILAADFLFFVLSTYQISDCASFIFFALDASLDKSDGSPLFIARIKRLGRLIHDSEVTLRLGREPDSSFIWHAAMDLISVRIGETFNLSRDIAEGLAIYDYPVSLTIVIIKSLENVLTESLTLDSESKIRNNLSVFLLQMGRVADAVVEAEKSVSILESLRDKKRPELEARLSNSLINLSNCLDRRGDTKNAIASLRRATKIYERICKINSVYMPDYADCLINLSIKLPRIGSESEALRIGNEAVNIYRTLTQTEGDRHEPDLAIALNNLSILFSKVEEYKSALEAAEKSLKIRERLNKKRPEVYSGLLVNSLISYSLRLEENGQILDAIKAMDKAKDISKALAKTIPSSFLPVLASCHYNLSNQLSSIETKRDALAEASKALDIYEKLASKDFDVYALKLAYCFRSISLRYSEEQRNEEALEATRKEVIILRKLTRKNSELHSAELASGLHNLALDYLTVRLLSKSLSSAKAAVSIRKQLAKDEPEKYRIALKNSSNLLTTIINEIRKND